MSNDKVQNHKSFSADQKTLHYTVEEIMAMPGYCRDEYEREIQQLKDKVEAANDLLRKAQPKPNAFGRYEATWDGKDIDNFIESLLKVLVGETKP